MLISPWTYLSCLLRSHRRGDSSDEIAIPASLEPKEMPCNPNVFAFAIPSMGVVAGTTSMYVVIR